MTGLHPCAVEGCDKQVPAAKLMCLWHWRGLPEWIQREVNTTWKRVHRDRQSYDDARTAAVKFWRDKAADRAANEAEKAAAKEAEANKQGKLF